MTLPAYNPLAPKSVITMINLAEKYFIERIDMFISSEYFMFYFDYLACPYVDEPVRKKMIEKVKEKTLDNKQNKVEFNVNKQSQIVLNKDFIVSWRDPKYLKNSLEKKKFIFSYN